jgi:hypothetical protein
MGGVGSPTYKRFEEYACAAYNILRHHATLLITLFFLMMACGLPELQEEKDIYWLRDKLAAHLSDAEGAAEFRKLITQSMNTTATYVNHAVHSFAHA